MKISTVIRRPGKTTNLINYMMDHPKSLLVVSTKIAKEYFKTKSLQSRIVIFDDLFNGNLKGRNDFNELVIDDFDLLIPKLFFHNLNISEPITHVTINANEIVTNHE